MANKDWQEVLANMDREDSNASRRYRRHNLSLDLMGDPIVSSNNNIDELQYSLEKAMKKLTWKQQRLLKLLYFDGHSQKEVAKMFGCNESSVTKMKQRALKELKKIIG